jgi:hypothetical protein
MSETFAKQKKVPIPRVGRAAAPRPRKYPFADMAIGEMFFIPDVRPRTMYTYASQMGRKLDRRFTTRALYMVKRTDGWEEATATTPRAKLGVAIWRVA